MAIVDLQAYVRKLSKQMAHIKKGMKEPPCFDGVYSDPIIYWRWVQTLEDYFEAKGCSHGESFLITTQDLQ